MEGNEEKEFTYSAGMFSAVFVSDSFMLPCTENPESVNLGVNCKNEPAVTKIKTEVNDLCVSSDELGDKGLQGNVCDAEIMRPELNTTFIKAEYLEENTNSDNNLVQDPLLLTEKDFLDFAKRENLKIDLNLDDKSIIGDHIKGIGSDLERRDSNSFIRPIIKMENTEINSFEQLNSKGTQDASICNSVKRECVGSLRAGDVGMEVERNYPDPLHELFVLREDYSEEFRMRGEESRVDEDAGSSKEVMSVASREGKQTSRIKRVGRKKAELPSNGRTVSQAFDRRLRSPASENKFSTKSMMKNRVSESEEESNPLTEHSLGQQCHLNGTSEFTSNSPHEMHRTTHTGDEPFKCSNCEYKCYYNRDLKRHMMAHTKTFQCTICDYKSSEQYNLMSHLLCHSDDKPFQCTMCVYKSARKQDLMKHLTSHSGDKPFLCTICGYKSSRKQSLDRHNMTHSLDKPFKCTICDYKCNRKEHLKRHSMTHSGDKPFQCTICDYKCSLKHHLKTHLTRCHSGDKPFQCTICDYKCYGKEHLKTHILTHTS